MLHEGHEDITDSAHGLDQHGALGIDLDFKDDEQFELACGEGDFLAFGREQLASGQIQSPAGKTHPISDASPARFWCRPSQYTAHSCQKLAKLEGLGQVIVCPDLKTDDTIDRLALTGQDDDSDV
jgi:hypothetical protein